MSSAFLASAMEELSESCYGDAKTAKSIVEELTLSCHMNEADLRKFIGDVSKSCPMDVKKLKNEVVKANGKKDLAFQAITKAGSRGLQNVE